MLKTIMSLLNGYPIKWEFQLYSDKRHDIIQWASLGNRALGLKRYCIEFILGLPMDKKNLKKDWSAINPPELLVLRASKACCCDSSYSQISIWEW